MAVLNSVIFCFVLFLVFQLRFCENLHTQQEHGESSKEDESQVTLNKKELVATARMPHHKTDGIFDLISPIELLRLATSPSRQIFKKIFDLIRHPSIRNLIQGLSPANLFRTVPAFIAPVVGFSVLVSVVPQIISALWSWVGPGKLVPEFGARSYSYKLDDIPLVRTLETLDILDMGLQFFGVEREACRAKYVCETAQLVRNKAPGVAGFLKAMQAPLSRATAYWPQFFTGLQGVDCEVAYKECSAAK